ncbi:MAG: signal transduction histidine kinase [Hyphomicrobiaceae bacterium]
MAEIDGTSSALGPQDSYADGSAGVPEWLSSAPRTTLVGLLIAGCAFAGGSITAQGETLPTVLMLQLTQVVVVLAAIRWLRRPHAEGSVIAVGVAAFTVIYATGASVGVIEGQGQTTALLICAVALASSILLPWDVRPQLATVSIAGGALLATLYFLSGDSIRLELRAIHVLGFAFIFLCSVIVAWQFNRYRERTGVDHRALLMLEKKLEGLDSKLEEHVIERTSAIEATNHELQSFSYMVSHELRAPLRVVAGFSVALIEDYGAILDERGIEHVDRIRAATGRMSDTIDGLLELSGICKSEFERSPVDLSAFAEATIADLQAAAPERIVEINIAPELVVSGESSLVRVLVANLLGNAWKFTATTDGARIDVEVDDRDGRSVITVRDNGVGFEAGSAEDLFQPFWRGHTESEFAGSGIGLATVRRIVERHGGRVCAEGSPGQGATIHFTLDAEPGKEPREQQAAVERLRTGPFRPTSPRQAHERVSLVAARSS